MYAITSQRSTRPSMSTLSRPPACAALCHMCCRPLPVKRHILRVRHLPPQTPLPSSSAPRNGLSLVAWQVMAGHGRSTACPASSILLFSDLSTLPSVIAISCSLRYSTPTHEESMKVATADKMLHQVLLNPSSKHRRGRTDECDVSARHQAARKPPAVVNLPRHSALILRTRANFRSQSLLFGHREGI